MSLKNLDNKRRHRCYTTAFRMSPEEHDQLNELVKLSGLQKQDYMIKKSLDKTIVVTGNTRTYKALRDEINTFNALLHEYIDSGIVIDDELLDMMLHVVSILERLSK
ncbi:MAG: hypothetical protein LUG60_05335 [Erysipelotrichaceae bacterium]|nr:hypothetical protein [Erysipelotrichaceae bacterium]